jgi:hypothetical protein
VHLKLPEPADGSASRFRTSTANFTHTEFHQIAQASLIERKFQVAYSSDPKQTLAVQPKADMSDSGLLARNLAFETHSAGDKSLL